MTRRERALFLTTAVRLTALADQTVGIVTSARNLLRHLAEELRKEDLHHQVEIVTKNPHRSGHPLAPTDKERRAAEAAEAELARQSAADFDAALDGPDDCDADSP